VLPLDEVRLGVEQHLRAARGEQPHGGLVGHRAAREEQRLLLAEQLRHARLEAAHGRVAVEDVVAHLASAMARRMAGVGRVTVSERRSTGADAGGVGMGG
jgi:hypothetical protein